MDGVEIVPLHLVQETSTTETKFVCARSDESEPVIYEITNLENPLAIRLINTVSDEDLVAFVSRFGLPQKLVTPFQVSVTSLETLKEDLGEVLGLGAFPDSVEKARHVNDVLKYVSLAPSFEYADGRNKLVMRPTDLANLMMMEAVFAYEVGATLSRCAHCSKAYLTGPLTGRRSHAVYCSDRCRVAAMRKRNASAGKHQELTVLAK
ncbi:hypothetical protein [Mesorhizobium loti]|uniref:hypothetical protein n=1 Tax=Rhizobium loti TaxID=381 RepID=UPI0012DB2F97|nr:hypothetical protein [Mesorhizobium loti]